MTIAVLSDLHLKQAKSELGLALVDLLQKFSNASEPISELWLLGDIFDLLVGPFSFWRAEYAEFFAALATLNQKGCKILWLEGNHDFHLQELLKPYAVEVLDGEQSRVVGGKKVFFAHGDLVNLDDAEYLKWRGFTRDATFRKLLDWVPNRMAQFILRPLAHKLSHASRARTRDEETEINHRYRAFADRKFREGFDAVFLGHCHVADLYTEGNHFYCNLGSALNGTLHYAIWNPQIESFPKVKIHSKMNR